MKRGPSVLTMFAVVSSVFPICSMYAANLTICANSDMSTLCATRVFATQRSSPYGLPSQLTVVFIQSLRGVSVKIVK